MLCHCGLTRTYNDCCGRFINGTATPQTAEELMRSRYSAYIVEDAGYLIDSTAPAKRRDTDHEDIIQTFEECQWLKLEVRKIEKGQHGNKHGQIEFMAYFEGDGQLQEHHEIADFVCLKNKWYYFDGELLA
jgi:SEC-C motif-containing protein